MPFRGWCRGDSIFPDRDSRVAKRLFFWFDGCMKKSAALCLLACCVFCTGMSKKPKFTVSIHGEGAPEDNPKMIFTETLGGQKMIFKNIPEFSHVNIAAFQPFPDPDGNGNGVTLKLDFRGTNALEVATRMRPGQVLLAKVNGRSCDVVTIDRPVADGIFTIWSGVPDVVIADLKKKYPLISQSRSAGGVGIEMTPTTKKEKRDALSRAKAETKKKAKDEAARLKAEKNGTPPPEPNDGLPRGAATNQIPLEGGAPALPLR